MITLTVEEKLSEPARLVANAQGKTLNAAFQKWLERYTARAGTGAAIETLMRRLKLSGLTALCSR